MYKVGMISLGCPKNQVDAELMLAKLVDAGFTIVGDANQAEIVIVNTCGFIDDAKKEAIENILDMANLKEAGIIKKIIVTGCLAQRYKQEVLEEFPEIDSVIGIGANNDIVEVCKQVMEDKKVSKFPPKTDLCIEGQRVLTTPDYCAYLKIAEGCSNCCTYCAIPKIRGPLRSRSIESIVEEAKALVNVGVKEIILVAQDTTRYGLDRYKKFMLPTLLDELCKIDGIKWIRMLYCYPEALTDELIDTIAKQDKVLNYIDLPIQHADKDVLKAMNRTGDKEKLLTLVNKLRSKIPDVVLRTTLMVGFPGETKEAFETLAEFVKEAKFDRLGCFTYSAEEGTPAATFPNQIEEDEKIHRGELIMQAQYDIFISNSQKDVGKVLEVLVEGFDSQENVYFGRSYKDSPEIDGKVIFTCEKEIAKGDFVNVQITAVNDYDLIGEAVD